MKETKGEKKQGKRERNFCPRGDLDNTLPLGRQKTDVTYRKMRVYKAKGETPSQNECLILIGHINQVNQKGFLIAGLRHFDSWAFLSSQPQRRKSLNKGIDLSGQLQDLNPVVVSKAEGMGEEQDLSCSPYSSWSESLHLPQQIYPYPSVLDFIHIYCHLQHPG